MFETTMGTLMGIVGNKFKLPSSIKLEKVKSFQSFMESIGGKNTIYFQAGKSEAQRLKLNQYKVDFGTSGTTNAANNINQDSHQ